MARRIVIVGSGGRLGAALLREWRALGDEVLGFNRALLDLADFRQIHELLEPLDFDVLVNCAAQTNVDRCESEVEEAFRVNSAAVGTLGDLCTRKKARCVHIGTDYVFDGEKETPYTEDDLPRPLSKYGESKLSGERCLHAVSDKHLVVRVSWIFGPDRPSFVDQILQRALDHETVEAIADKVSSPTLSLDVAKLLRPLLEEPGIDAGVVHLSNAGGCSWQEYGQYALDCALRAGVPLKGRFVKGLKLDEFPAFKARRPRRTALDASKLTRLTGVAPRPWQESVEEYVRDFWAAKRR